MLTYDLIKIGFTYKQQVTSFRGGIKNVCTIYYSDRKIAELIPGENDWNNDEIKNVVYEFLEAGINRKFIGYNLKDVET